MTTSTTDLSLSVCHLQPRLDLGAAGELKQNLERLLKDGTRVVIDAGNVINASTACLTILLGFLFEARKRAVPVSLQNQTPALKQSLELLGLTEIIKAMSA